MRGFWVWAVAASLALPLGVACDSGGGDATTGGDGATAGDTGSDDGGGDTSDVDSTVTGDDTSTDDPTGVGDETAATDGTADGTGDDTAVDTPGFDPATCAPTISGTLETTAGDIDLAGVAPELTASHLLAEGCLTQLQVTLALAEGCALEVTLYGAAGAWELSGGTFDVSSSCGLAIADGAWALDAAGSTGALIEPPTVAADTADTCLDVTALAAVGLARFTSGDETFEVDLGSLAIGGTLHAQAVAEGSCPAAVTPCAGMTCGPDAYGVACGTCGEGELCDAGQCASQWCPPPQFGFGTHPGDVLADVVVYDCDGTAVHLHELCGAKAGYFNLLAGW